MAVSLSKRRAILRKILTANSIVKCFKKSLLIKLKRCEKSVLLPIHQAGLHCAVPSSHWLAEGFPSDKQSPALLAFSLLIKKT